MIIPILRRLILGVGMLLPAIITSCSAQATVPPPKKIRLDDTHLHSFDGDKLPYTKWMPRKKPQTVIIGVHGISGAASDYQPLATKILSEFSDIAIYSAETRGQGNDPIKERRGHIQDRRHWFKDLTAFNALLRKKYPDAKIIWCGESMGALIALHTYAAAEDKKNLCDAMILSSPITAIRDDYPRWKVNLANLAGFLFPKARISLESLAGDREVRVTKDTIHSEQAATNSYHLERQTLHLLTTLGKMMETLPEAGQELDIPLLVLHGGKDVFSDPKDVKAFIASLPDEVEATRIFYPKSFHLLFYDHQRDQVVADIATWIKKLGTK